MKNYYSETKLNAERFFAHSEMHSFSAKCLDNSGYSARIDTIDRSFFINCRIDGNSQLLIFKVSPSIHCAPEYRCALSEYIIKVNDHYKQGNIRISLNGEVFLHSEQRFDDSAVTVSMLENIQDAALQILDTFSVPIEKLAFGKLLTPEEADVDNVIDAHRKNLLEERRKERSKRLNDTDEQLRKVIEKMEADGLIPHNDDDISDDVSIVSSRRAMLERMRKENAERVAGFEMPEEKDACKSGLLDALLKADEDEDEDEDEEGASENKKEDNKSDESEWSE